jgi:uncharacterized membrane protein YiaA
MNTKATAVLSLKLALLGSVVYFLGLWGLFLANQALSGAGDWWFRIVLVATLVIGILALKGRNNGQLSFAQGFKLGGLTTLFLAILMSVASWLYNAVVHPTYTQEYEQAYREFHYNRMLTKYVAENWKRDTITQGAIDTVQNGLDLNIKNYTGRLFTVGGQVQTTFIYAIFWGLLTALTVVLLAIKSPGADQRDNILDHKQ